ncbi:tetratricopeptide repeat-containing sensor histidine kinase [Tenacibaculum sp. TC6]|uniref:tetratricopeptide repeat-containing sensor histidine kinase n=1 Tax=Tenacibaculum sp. TC6 TaxID=3423223 RepID=UPI003D363494
MFFKVKRYCFLFIGIVQVGFSQTTYIEDFFIKNCNSCYQTTKETTVKLPDTYEYAWHNAHVAFSNKDYEKVNYYLLKDTYTNPDLKKIIQSHLLFRLKLYDEAEKQIRDLEKVKDEDYHVIIAKTLGDFYEKRNYDSAIVYYHKIIEEKNISIQLKNEVNESLAYIHLSKKEFKKAETSYKALLKVYKKDKDKKIRSLARVYSNLGNLYFEQYKDELAKRYFDSAYVLAKPSKDLPLRSFIVYNLYIVSEAMKEHEKAVLYLKEYTVLQDSIQKENTVWQVAQQKEAFNIAKKEAEIETKTAQRNLFLFFFIAVLVLLLTIYMFYKQLKHKHAEIQVLNKELEEANTLKNQMFSIVAHDLRSPVALLKQKLELSELNEEQTTITIDKKVTSIIDSLSFLLDNLLNWSLSQSNLLHVQKDWFPLMPVVKQIIQQYSSLLQEKNIEYNVNHISSILIFGDMELFKIVLRNCLDNAIKFTPKGGRITLSGSAEEDLFKLSIQDSGVGIPDTVLKTIFEVHAQKAQKDTEGRKSSGLGLHLVKHMMVLNDGVITIRNHIQGGTVVTISMPYKTIT